MGAARHGMVTRGTVALGAVRGTVMGTVTRGTVTRGTVGKGLGVVVVPHFRLSPHLQCWGSDWLFYHIYFLSIYD